MTDQQHKHCKCYPLNIYRGLTTRLTWPAAPEEERSEEYVNLQAFLAHLQQYRIFPTDPRFAVCAMCDAFENPQDDDPAWVRDALVMGAVQWILWNGQDLFIQHRYPGDKAPKSPSEYDSGGPEYIDEPYIMLNRWHIWRDGFRAVAGEKCQTSKECEAAAGEKYEPSGECKAIALKAADMMDAFEKNMSL